MKASDYGFSVIGKGSIQTRETENKTKEPVPQLPKVEIPAEAAPDKKSLKIIRTYLESQIKAIDGMLK